MKHVSSFIISECAPVWSFDILDFSPEIVTDPINNFKFENKNFKNFISNLDKNIRNFRADINTCIR